MGVREHAYTLFPRTAKKTQVDKSFELSREFRQWDIAFLISAEESPHKKGVLQENKTPHPFKGLLWFKVLCSSQSSAFAFCWHWRNEKMRRAGEL